MIFMNLNRNLVKFLRMCYDYSNPNFSFENHNKQTDKNFLKNLVNLLKKNYLIHIL